MIFEFFFLQNPIPVDPYKTDFEANNDSAICIQAGFPGSPTVIGQEDCLYLNVYTPLVSKIYPILSPKFAKKHNLLLAQKNHFK